VQAETTSKHISFWLTPPQEGPTQIQQVIQHGSKVCGTPRFMPHVTIASGQMEAPVAKALVAKLAGAGPIKGHMTEPFRGDGSKISQTMGYHFEASEESQGSMQRISETLKASTIAKVVNRQQLHMSLIYRSGGLSDSLYRNLEAKAQEQEIDRNKVDLSEIHAVAIPIPFDNENQIKDWSVIASAKLEI